MADEADVFSLYTAAVQDPEATVKRCSSIYEQKFGCRPSIIREDFCGTAANCVAWARADPEARLVGVDIDDRPLQWCQTHVLSQCLDKEATQIALIHSDVLTPTLPAANLILALNGSFCAIKSRSRLSAYFSRCLRALSSCGMLILELYTGPEAQMIGLDFIHCAEFTAIWEQATFNAVTNATTTHLHFSFPDSSCINRAFSYDWRLWSPAELLDGINDAGFAGGAAFDLKSGTTSSPAACAQAYVNDHWTLYIVAWT